MTVSIASAAERIVASSSAAIFLTDRAQRCIYMNPAAARLCGPTPAFASRPLHDALPHVGRDGAPCGGTGCALAAALAGQGPASGDARFVRDDGHVFPVTFAASTESEGGGTILEAWAPGADGPIARALRESEERYRFLAETIPVQIWTARPDGLLDYVTEQTARHFGLTVDRLLAEGWQNVVHPADLAHAVERWTNALSTGCTYEVEFRLRLADGTYAYHLARAVPQRNAKGDVVRWFGTNTDIDEQREEQRRTRALLDEVALQARESESVLVTLRRQKADAEARIVELEQRIARGHDAP